MSKESVIHWQVNWAKERLDEIDGTLASLEGKVDEVQAGVRAKANEVLIDLRKRRDDFKQIIKKYADANEAYAEAHEAAWISAKQELEAQWAAFEADVTKYVESVGSQVEQQHAICKRQAAAQLNAWREQADKLTISAKECAAERRGEIDEVLKRIKTEASTAEEKLQKLMQAGTQSWSAMMVALSETRTSFDRANQAAKDAFGRAARS
jgi:hypothetical protein